MQMACALGVNWTTVNGFTQDELWLGLRPLKKNRLLLRASAIKMPGTTMPGLLDEALVMASDVFMRGKNLWLRGPILGEAFFGYCSQDPRKLVMSPCPKSEGPVPYIAMHFRGTDFFTWNENAILPSSYYMNSLEWARDQVGPDAPVYLVTDDTSLDSFKYVRKCLGSSARVFNGAPESDFCVLHGASILVSSPSTFCIWAGILGNSSVVHSLNWVTQRASLRDEFWVRILKGGNDFYHPAVLI